MNTSKSLFYYINGLPGYEAFVVLSYKLKKDIFHV